MTPFPPNFPGVGTYLDKVVEHLAEPAKGQARAALNDSPVLHEVADIVAQAWSAPPGHRKGIADAALTRGEVITLAAKAFDLVVDDLLAKLEHDEIAHSIEHANA